MNIAHPPFKITAAKTHHASTSIAHPVKTAFGTMTERHALFLALQNEAGQIGIGESWINFPIWGHLTRIAAFETVINPWLLDRIVEHVPDTSRQLFQMLEGPARQSGTIGSLLAAVCAVELALWDLAAQSAEKRLADLLFNDPHNEIKVYASGINRPLPFDLIDVHLERGVTLFKLKLGFGDEEDLQNLTAMKRHLGERAELAVDVNRGWRFSEAKRWLPILADHDIRWLEEPLRFDEEQHLAELQALSSVPLAGGENIQMEPGLPVESFAMAAFDILQPDVTKYTPLHVALGLRTAVESAEKQMIPHILGSGPGQAASLQLAAGCAAGLVELDINENKLRTEICEPAFQIENGKIALPNRTGIGWRLKRGQ